MLAEPRDGSGTRGRHFPLQVDGLLEFSLGDLGPPFRGPVACYAIALQAGGFFWALTAILSQILEITPFHGDDQIQECQALVNKVPSLIRKGPCFEAVQRCRRLHLIKSQQVFLIPINR